MLTEITGNELNVLFADLSETSKTKKQSKRWQCVLPETFIGDYLIVPLTSSKKLKSEGYCMNNCCREYIEKCELGYYTVFSIRERTGERLATLGISYEDGYWRFDQCYGPSNTEVLEEVLEYFDDDGVLQTEWLPTEIYYVAHETVRLMNNASSNVIASH